MILKSYPAEDGFSMPAEYEKHKGCFMIWPWRPGSWGKDATDAKKAFVQIASAIARSEDLYMAATEKTYDEALKMLNSSVFHDRLHLFIADNDDAWARDTGATFVVDRSKKTIRGIDWQFNAWGGSFDGLYADWDADQCIARIISDKINADVYDATDFVLEGGSIHTDGEGTLITTEECLLSKGRNPSLSKEQIEEKLKQYLDVHKVIWIPEGIYNDETNGHIDNMCCFCSPGEVLLAWTDDQNDPQYDRSQRAYEVLSNTTDAQGRNIKIHKLLIPQKPVCITKEDLDNYVFEEGEDERECGERLAASYVNFYIANEHVLVPQFHDINDENALRVIQGCFPTRKVVGIDALAVLKGGGNIHCITQQIPFTN